MSPFFSNKMKDSDYATLARVVYLTILKQHDAVVAASRLAYSKLAGVVAEPVIQPVEVVPEAAPEVSSVDEFPTPAPASLSDQMVDTSGPSTKSIKLDL